MYELPKIVKAVGTIAEEYKKMNDEEKGKIVWEGAKALIAGAFRYSPQQAIPAIYSAFMENSPWGSTVDFVANILKKYGGDGNTMDVVKKIADDFVEKGVRNKPS